MSVRPRANARSSHRKAPEGPGSCHPLSSCVPCSRGRAKDGALRLGWSREGGEGGSLHRGTSTAFRAKSYEWGASGARGAAPWGRTDGPTGPGTRGTRPAWQGPFCSQQPDRRRASVPAHGSRRKLCHSAPAFPSVTGQDLAQPDAPLPATPRSVS